VFSTGTSGAYTPTESSRVESSRVESSRVESSPVHSSQTHKNAALTLWITYNGSRGSVYTPGEQSRVESNEPCRVMSLDAICSIFASQTQVIVRDG